jgi:hypothetical protein
MEPLRRKRPKRAYSAVAVLGGIALLMFELGKWSTSSPEKWFWALIAVLMIALGLVGVFQREDDSGA